jgi:DNA polymerase delta subunit 1
MLAKRRTIHDGIEDDENKKLLFLDTYVKWEWPEMMEQETKIWPSSWYRRPISPDALCVLMGSGLENKYNVKNDFQITFQNVTMDYKMRDIKKEFSVYLPSYDSYATKETLVRQEPEIRITGTTKQGNSICTRVRGFLPYFRVSLREGICLLKEEKEEEKEQQHHDLYTNPINVDIVKRCIQRYMCMNDSSKETFRLASNHAHLIQFFLKEVLIEYFDMLWYALRKKEITMSDDDDEEEEMEEEEKHFTQEEYEDNNEYLKNEFQNLLFDFKRNSITLRNKILKYGDREPVLCPHASRLLSKMEINFPDKEYRRASGVLPNEFLWLEIIKKKIGGGKGLGENDNKLIEIEKKERTFVEDYSKHLHGFDYNNPIVEVHCDLCKAFFKCLEYTTKTCYNISKIFLQSDTTNGNDDNNNVDFDFFNNQLNLLNNAWETFSSSVDKTVLEPLETFYSEVIIEQEKEENWIYYDESKYMQYISKVEYEEKTHHTFIDLDQNKKSFLRIELFRPPDCPYVRNAIQYAGLLIKLPTLIIGDDGGLQQEIFHHTDWVQTYESDVPFVTRFSRDTQIDGMGWVVAEPYSWEPIPIWYNQRKDGRERISKCQVEILIHNYKKKEDKDKNITLNISGRNTHEHGDEWGETAPIRSLVFDIEVARQTGDLNEFVSPGNPGDLTTQISCYVYEQGKRDEPLEVSLFCLGGCEPILRRANKEEELSDVERSYYRKTRIYCFSCERELFLAFRRFVEINSFDVVVSYNGISFDMVYMLNRNQNVSVLGPGIQAIFGKLGRFIERRVYYNSDDNDESNNNNGKLCGDANEDYKWSGLAYLSKISFQSKQTGLKEYECVKIPGMVQFDIYRVIMANKKLRSYKLDFVMKKLIKMGKLELGHIGITRHAISLYDIHRSVVSRYCEFDTIGTMKVEESQEYLVTYTEMARLTGVVIDDLLTKGQTVKVSSLLMSFTKLLREMKIKSEYTQNAISYMIPYMKDIPMNLNPSVLSTLSWMIEGINDDLNNLYGKPEKEAYVGGHVFEPVRGFHRLLIFCLDFASLYPSIMISYNICYTTHISSKEKAIAMGFKCAWDFRPIEEGGDGPIPAEMMKEPEGDFWTMQQGHCFVKRHVREGVIPMLLLRILSARGREKRKMNSYFYGTMEWLRHNAAQISQKLVANSVYGFTAANLRGRHISAAVTYMGRYLIQETNKHSICYGEKHPEFRNSNKYGDTDSTMNSFDNKPPANKETEEYTTEEMLESAHMAIKIANYVTGIFQAQGFFQIKLEFEKIYKRAVFLKRKKYAVWKFEFDPKDNSFKPHLDSKGLETVRRDTTDFIQEVFQRILEIVVKDGKLEEGIKYAQEQITKLRSGQIPLEKLVITGNFSKRPDQYSNPVPHIEAAKRARLIDPTSAPNVGERISYVVVIRNEDNLLENSKIPLYERTETYRVAKSKGMKIDYPHYVDLCIPILCRFFSACIAPKMSQQEGTEVAEKVIFRDAFEKEESIKRFENSALVKKLGVYKKKRKTFQEKEKESSSKVITIDQLFGKSNNNKKKEKRKNSKVKKRKKEEKSNNNNNNDNDSDDLNSILTSATSYAEWCKEKGMDIKGRKYKRKR